MSPSSPRFLTPLSRNCLRNGAACGYLGTSNSHPNSPSTNLTVDSMSLLPPVSSANTPTTSVFDVFLSQRRIPEHHQSPPLQICHHLPSALFFLRRGRILSIHCLCNCLKKRGCCWIIVSPKPVIPFSCGPRWLQLHTSY
jgi:hypothetical protein